MKKERSRKFTLDWPIEVKGGKDIAELTLVRPKGRKTMAMGRAAMNASEEEQQMIAVSIVTGLPMEQVEEIDGEDFIRLLEEITDFLPQSASQSATSSTGDP